MGPFHRWLLKLTNRFHDRLVGTNPTTEGQEELERYIQMLEYSVSHDLRGPLRSILGFSSVLQENLPEGTPEHNYATLIAKAARQMSEKIDRLVMFNRIRVATPKLTPVAAEMLFEEAKNAFPSLAEAQSIQLNCEPPVNTRFLGDLQQLMQVLIVLIQNAAEAIGQAGTITVRARLGKSVLSGKKREVVVIEVEDTGPGMDESVKCRLFHPFFTTKPHGIGLGLATAARIAAMHGGAIEFRTKLGHGTTFSVILPACEKP